MRVLSLLLFLLLHLLPSGPRLFLLLLLVYGGFDPNPAALRSPQQLRSEDASWRLFIAAGGGTTLCCKGKDLIPVRNSSTVATDPQYSGKSTPSEPILFLLFLYSGLAQHCRVSYM
jgi:hypothetical protein